MGNKTIIGAEESRDKATTKYRLATRDELKILLEKAGIVPPSSGRSQEEIVWLGEF